jgi:hypothetical protein
MLNKGGKMPEKKVDVKKNNDAVSASKVNEEELWLGKEYCRKRSKQGLCTGNCTHCP